MGTPKIIELALDSIGPYTGLLKVRELQLFGGVRVAGERGDGGDIAGVPGFVPVGVGDTGQGVGFGTSCPELLDVARGRSEVRGIWVHESRS